MNSKLIGNEYEREASRMLSEWLTTNSKKLVAWRSRHSGSVGTIAKKNNIDGEKLDGDFQVLDEKYRSLLDTFFIDSKSLTKCNFFFNKKNLKSNKLLKQWIKVVKDAADKKPMMIVKVRDDRKVPDFVVLKFGTYHETLNGMNYRIQLNDTKYEFSIIPWDDFIEYNPWQKFVDDNKAVR
jgi:hypothetical protein